MKMLFKSAGAALCMTLAAQSVQAAEKRVPACMPPIEAEALMLTVAPSLIREMGRVCAGTLPGNAYLLRDAPALADKYEAAAQAVDAAAIAAFRRFGGKDLNGISDDLLRPQMKADLGKIVAQDMNPKDCTAMDVILANLAPLPPENAARLFIAILQIRSGESKKGSSRSPEICL